MLNLICLPFRIVAAIVDLALRLFLIAGLLVVVLILGWFVLRLSVVLLAPEFQ